MHPSRIRNRFMAALAAYGVLMVLAFVLLTGKVLAAVLILVVGLLLKTLVAFKAGWNDE